MKAERGWLGVTIAATVLIAAFDVLAARHAVLIGLLIVAPLAAAARLGPRRTVEVGGLALALALVLGVPAHIFGSLDHLVRCMVVAVGAVFAVLIAKVRSQRERKLARVTRVAEVAQRAILRPIPARVGGASFVTRYLSASEEALIGGDFCDAVATTNGVRVLVGDVKGKGLEAIKVASVVLGCFRGAADSTESLVDLAGELDRSIGRYLGDEDFVTAVLVELGRRAELRVANCGHPPPLLLHDGQVIPLASVEAVTPLGLGAAPTLERFALARSDRLLLYTDGLVEAADRQGRQFGVDGRAARILASASLDEALDGLVGLLLAHTGGHLGDDLALVLLQPSRLRVARKPAVHAKQPGSA